MFIYGLKDFAGSIIYLAEMIFVLCDVFSTTLQEESRNTYYDFDMILPLLLRLYDQALSLEKAEIPNRCLDIWDAFFQQRIGLAMDLTKAIEN